MPKKSQEWPDKGELVIGTVTKVNPYSAYVKLEEYGKEGMIHISEVSRRWIKDIKELVKENQTIIAVVVNVNRGTNEVYLSLKRVNKHDASERMKEYKREQKAERMLNEVAKEMKINLNEAYKQIGFKLQENFGEMFKAFQLSTTQPGFDLLIRKGIPESIAKIIRSVAEKHMETKEMIIKGLLELICYKSNGVEIIKKILEEAESKYGIEVKYISAPKYRLELKTNDAKFGEKKLVEATNSIITRIKSDGGEGNFRLEKM